MNFGIDEISFYTSNYYLDLRQFAKARGHDVAKFYDNLGQNKMAVISPDEDVVTLAANAVAGLAKDNDFSDVEMVMFATETGVDLSKAASTYIHRLFNLPKRCRVIELKQACYSATFGMQMALAWLRHNPNKKVLLIASDIARYQFGSTAESSQGCGAVAMLLSANPRILAIGSEAGFCTGEVMDFWRPNYSSCAFVDGRLSCEVYIGFVQETWRQYSELTGRVFSDHDRFCYHVPVAKLVETAHKRLARTNRLGKLTPEQVKYQLGNSLVYNRGVGNCYTASLYLSIISLLENTTDDLSGKLIGLYSYGSGSVGEFFAAEVMPGYKEWLKNEEHQNLLKNRKELSIDEYEKFYSFEPPIDGSIFEFPKYCNSFFRLQALDKHQRIYEKI